MGLAPAMKVFLAAGILFNGSSLIAAVDHEPEKPSKYKVKCESSRKRLKQCELSGNVAGVILKKQRSNAECKFGESWGYDNSSIWVDEGCRADFLVYENSKSRYYDFIVCQNHNGEKTECRLDWAVAPESLQLINEAEDSQCKGSFETEYYSRVVDDVDENHHRLRVKENCQGVFRGLRLFQNSFYIKPVHALNEGESGKCLDVERASTEDYANIEQFECKETENQRFTFGTWTEESNHWYSVTADHSGKAIGEDPTKETQGSKSISIVQLTNEPWDSFDYGLWNISKVEGKMNTYMFSLGSYSSDNYGCWDIRSRSIENGADLQVFRDCEADNLHQQFKLVPAFD